MGSALSNFFGWVEVLCYLTSAGLLVWQGFRDETFGLPLPALVLQCAWGFWFSFYAKDIEFDDQIYFILHLIMLGQLMVFGHKEFFAGQRLPLYGLVVAFLLPSVALMRAFIDEEGSSWTHNEVWYGVMCLTSILSVPMLLSRRDTRGQSLLAVLCRCGAMVTGWIHQHDAVITWLCIGSLMADAVYLYLLYLCREQPQTFRQYRNFLVSSDRNNSNNDDDLEAQHAGPLLSSNKSSNNHHGDVVYHPAPMPIPPQGSERIQPMAANMLGCV